LNDAACSDASGSFEDDLGMNHRILTDFHVEIHVGRRRIHDRHAAEHQLVEFLLTKPTIDCLKLNTGVDNHNLIGPFVWQLPDAFAPLLEYSRNVGKIILALCVVAVEAFERSEQLLYVKAINADVDFAYSPLLGRGVLLFD